MDHLVELLRIADEHQIASSRSHRERVGEGNVAGLVDEEVVERGVVLLVREEPRRAGCEVALNESAPLVTLSIRSDSP